MISSMWHLRGLIAAYVPTSLNARAPRDGEGRSTSSQKSFTRLCSKTPAVRRPRNLKRSIGQSVSRGNHFSRGAGVRIGKIAFCWNSQQSSSAFGHGGGDQPRKSLRLACRNRSGKNEAVGICSRDAVVSRLTVDRVDFGIRHQYPRHRRDTFFS
jgi:hypothetical protein